MQPIAINKQSTGIIIFLTLALLLTSCAAQIAEVGDTVSVEYTGTLDDGTPFDSTAEKGPMDFELGANQVIPGFDNAVQSLAVGESVTVRLEPADAYGETNPLLIREEPLENIQTDEDIRVGMVLMARTPDGQQRPVEVVEVTNESVYIDLNHPLAGQALNFEITLVEIQ